MFVFLPLGKVLWLGLCLGVDCGLTPKTHRCSSIRPRRELLIKEKKSSCSAALKT